MPWPFPLRTSLRTCGPFPPRALPRLYGTTGHSATLSARPDPCGLPVGVCYTAVRASRVATPSILHACQCQYPGGNRPVHVSFSSRSTSGLPHDTGGSASALPFSRPARHSLRVPACMLAKSPKRSFCQRASVHVVTSINRLGRYQLKRQLLRGIRTHKEEAPYHGARRVLGCPISPRVRRFAPPTPPRGPPRFVRRLHRYYHRI